MTMNNIGIKIRDSAGVLHEYPEGRGFSIEEMATRPFMYNVYVIDFRGKHIDVVARIWGAKKMAKKRQFELAMAMSLATLWREPMSLVESTNRRLVASGFNCTCSLTEDGEGFGAVVADHLERNAKK